MKEQANRGWREVKEWKREDRVILSIKDLVFKKRPVKKLTKRYMKLYIVEKIVSKNAVKLKLLASIKIQLVVNISSIVRYRELIKEQRVKELKLIKIDRVKE